MTDIATSPRRGRGKAAATIALVEESHRILSEIQPASVRAVCYRLFSAGLIRDMSKPATDAVSRQLVWARETGIIPWEWIVDETREAETVASWSSPEAIIESACRQYRLDYWSTQPQHVEVWTEKGTVRGTLAPVLREFGVTLRVMHGFGSATAIYQAAQDVAGAGKPVSILYAGDWDPSGMQMSEVDLPSRLARYGGTATITRLALTQGDVDSGTVPHFDLHTKSKDPRHKWFAEHFGQRCYELDALSPSILRERVRSAITTLLDMEQWSRCVRVEQAERDSMNDILGIWQRSISGPAENCSEGCRDGS